MLCELSVMGSFEQELQVGSGGRRQRSSLNLIFDPNMDSCHLKTYFVCDICILLCTFQRCNMKNEFVHATYIYQTPVGGGEKPTPTTFFHVASHSFYPFQSAGFTICNYSFYLEQVLVVNTRRLLH